MASVASSGTSPILGYDPFLSSDSGAETEESWAFINFASGATTTGSEPAIAAPASSIGFLPSPASRGSISSYAVVGDYQHVSSAELGSGMDNSQLLSASFSDVDHAQLPPPSVNYNNNSNNNSNNNMIGDGVAFGDAIEQNVVQMQSPATGLLDGTEMFFAPDSTQDFLAPGALFFDQQDMNYIAPYLGSSIGNTSTQSLLEPSRVQEQRVPAQMTLYGAQSAVQVPTPAEIQPASWQNLTAQANDPFVYETFDHNTYAPSIISSGSSDLSLSPVIKTEQHQQQQLHIDNDPQGSKLAPAIPIAIRKVRGAGSRIEKKKAATSASTSTSTMSGTLILSASSSSGSDSENSPNKGRFVIVTPRSITAQAGRPNPYECFEAMRPSQKGRKGPLPMQTKENALQVRRVGACFCCHARKVKCDTQRPCRNCKKLCTQVPQVVCWQFQDFLTVLFPSFVRAHFRREEMNRFMDEHVASYNSLSGVDESCSVELYSGPRFAATLSVKGRFFTPKTQEVLSHWHYQVGMANGTNLAVLGALPIGLGPDMTNPQREELRKKLKEYIGKIIQEPAFAEQVAESVNISTLPRRILQIVQNYAEHSDSTIVKRALSIYATHYVMTRHLTLTRDSINNLQQQQFAMVPQNAPWLTPRVLNRQLKAILDEYMTREVQTLFDTFSKSLKPKSKREWAPCLAAFLVLCLFMEAIETLADMFATSENEVDRREGRVPTYKKSFAQGITKEIEGLPFKQFAYQFHQVYQTHSKEANAKSFNPLVDDGVAEMAELDTAAMEMVLSLKQILRDDWAELDFFGADAFLPPNDDEDLFSRSAAHDYSTRLLSKFLLSFTDEVHIFGEVV